MISKAQQFGVSLGIEKAKIIRWGGKRQVQEEFVLSDIAKIPERKSAEQITEDTDGTEGTEGTEDTVDAETYNTYTVK